MDGTLRQTVVYVNYSGLWLFRRYPTLGQDFAIVLRVQLKSYVQNRRQFPGVSVSEVLGHHVVSDYYQEDQPSLDLGVGCNLY